MNPAPASLLPPPDLWRCFFVKLPIDPAAATIAAGGELRRLTPQEQAVLGVLLCEPLGSADLLMTALWGRWVEPPESASSALRMVIAGLRRKLEGCGAEVLTLRGLGYTLVLAPSNDDRAR